MAETLGIHEAIIGQRYEVNIGDCCCNASFTATLAAIDTREQAYSSTDRVDTIRIAVFDNGVRIDDIDGWNGGTELTLLP